MKYSFFGESLIKKLQLVTELKFDKKLLKEPEMNKELAIDTENERQISRLLARAIWISTQRCSGETDEPNSEKMRAEWSSAKPHMDRIADMTIRRLKAKNIELVKR